MKRANKDSAWMVASGVESMQRMNAIITEIKESFNKTSKIIKTIDEIAFQTNLLSLNAAVKLSSQAEELKMMVHELSALVGRKNGRGQSRAQGLEAANPAGGPGGSAGPDKNNRQQVHDKPG